MAGVADDDRWSDPERALATREVRDQVRQALGQLEEHYRLVLTLYYFDDVKYTEIAEILGVPLNTVKSHIRRGKERLAALLEAQEQPPAPHHAAQPPRNEPRGPFPGAAPLRLMFSGLRR